MPVSVGGFLPCGLLGALGGEQGSAPLRGERGGVGSQYVVPSRSEGHDGSGVEGFARLDEALQERLGRELRGCRSLLLSAGHDVGVAVHGSLVCDEAGLRAVAVLRAVFRGLLPEHGAIVGDVAEVAARHVVGLDLGVGVVGVPVVVPHHCFAAGVEHYAASTLERAG